MSELVTGGQIIHNSYKSTITYTYNKFQKGLNCSRQRVTTKPEGLHASIRSQQAFTKTEKPLNQGLKLQWTHPSLKQIATHHKTKVSLPTRTIDHNQLHHHVCKDCASASRPFSFGFEFAIIVFVCNWFTITKILKKVTKSPPVLSKMKVKSSGFPLAWTRLTVTPANGHWITYNINLSCGISIPGDSQSQANDVL
jgi:hypothetical protein